MRRTVLYSCEGNVKQPCGVQCAGWGYVKRGMGMAEAKRGVETVAHTFYAGCATLKAVLLFVAVGVYIVLTVFSGGSLAELLLFFAIMLAYIVLPGLFAADVLRAEKLASGARMPVALLLGSGFFAMLFCFSIRLHLPWLVRFAPPVFAACFAAWWAAQRLCWRGASAAAKAKRLFPFIKKPGADTWMLLLLFAALLLVFTFAGIVKNARPLAVGGTLIEQDVLWNAGNANSFKLAFPPIDIRYADVRLSYHYLGELLAGGLSFVSGIPAYNIVAFYMQPYVLAGLVLCLHRFGGVMWPAGAKKALAFPFSLFLLGCASMFYTLPNGHSAFGNTLATHLVTNINGVATAFMYLCIFLLLFVAAARINFAYGPVHFALMLAAFFMLCFSKGPVAAILACALALTMMAGIFLRFSGWRGVLLGVAVAAMFFAVYAVMYASGANQLVLSASDTLKRGAAFGNLWRAIPASALKYAVILPVFYVLQSFFAMPAQLLLYVRGLFHDIRHVRAVPPQRLLPTIFVPGGLLAYFVFSHVHVSQVYFLHGAVFFATILAVDNVRFLRPPAPTRRRKIFRGAVAVCAAAAVITSACLYVNLLGSGVRRLLWNTGAMEKYPYDMVVTPDDEAAMLYLRENSEPTDMFATNRLHSLTTVDNGISNVYTAFSGRQAYMEGYTYALTNMGVPLADVLARLEVNDALFSAGTPPEEVERLCRAHGIRYLVFSSQLGVQLGGSDTQLASFELLYGSASVRVYRIY